MFRFQRSVGWLLGIILPAVLGCGAATVTGNVTYDGKPVTRGRITFVAPEDDGAVGTEIVEGKYTLKGLSPGKKQVDVLIQATEGQPPLLPPEVVQGESREIARGHQTVDFPLHKPEKREPAKQ
jgi:hypothetical protein